MRTRMWVDAQRDGRPATARVPRNNAANIWECKTWTRSEFCTCQNSVRGKSPRKCMYSVLAQETAKPGAKFGWPPLSDVGAVTKPRRETRWNLLGCPKLANWSQPKLTILWEHVEEILLLTSFLDCRYIP